MLFNFGIGVVVSEVLGGVIHGWLAIGVGYVFVVGAYFSAD